MKKLIKICLFLLLTLCLTISFIACKSVKIPTINDLPIDYSTCEVVENMNAYDLFNESYNNFKEDRNYKRTEYFSFEGKMDMGGILVATQQGKRIKKMDGNGVYSESVTVGTGKGDLRSATKFYSDGTKNTEININDKKLIPNQGSGEKIFEIPDWGKYTDFNGDATAKINTYRTHLTFYDLSKFEYLSNMHDNKVYTKENVFYFTLRVNCSKDMMETVQTAANQEFINSLNPDKNSLELEDTIIDFAVAKVDGKYKFLAVRNFEKYSGKQSGLKINCEQTTNISFSYSKSDYTINNNDLLK